MIASRNNYVKIDIYKIFSIIARTSLVTVQVFFVQQRSLYSSFLALIGGSFVRHSRHISRSHLRESVLKDAYFDGIQ